MPSSLPGKAIECAKSACKATNFMRGRGRQRIERRLQLLTRNIYGYEYCRLQCRQKLMCLFAIAAADFNERAIQSRQPADLAGIDASRKAQRVLDNIRALRDLRKQLASASVVEKLW